MPAPASRRVRKSKQSKAPSRSKKQAASPRTRVSKVRSSRFGSTKAAIARARGSLDEKKLGISDDAVRKATTRSWPDWIAILDRFDVKKHGHTAAAAMLYDRHGCPGWWCQMIVVGYERVRGLRRVREQVGGFSASASRVINAPADRVFDAVVDVAISRRWLPKGVVVHKATRARSARMTWIDGVKCLSVWIGEKTDKAGAKRTTVQVQHEKIPDAKTCDRLKAMWLESIETLKKLVER